MGGKQIITMQSAKKTRPCESLNGWVSSQCTAAAPIPRCLLFCKTNPIPLPQNNRPRHFNPGLEEKSQNKPNFNLSKSTLNHATTGGYAKITPKEQVEKTNPISNPAERSEVPIHRDHCAERSDNAISTLAKPLCKTQNKPNFKSPVLCPLSAACQGLSAMKKQTQFITRRKINAQHGSVVNNAQQSKGPIM